MEYKKPKEKVVIIENPAGSFEDCPPIVFNDENCAKQTTTTTHILWNQHGEAAYLLAQRQYLDDDGNMVITKPEYFNLAFGTQFTHYGGNPLIEAVPEHHDLETDVITHQIDEIKPCPPQLEWRTGNLTSCIAMSYEQYLELMCIVTTGNPMPEAGNE